LPELRKDPITGRWVSSPLIAGSAHPTFYAKSVLVTGPKNCPFCPGAEGKTPPEILVYAATVAAILLAGTFVLFLTVSRRLE